MIEATYERTNESTQTINFENSDVLKIFLNFLEQGYICIYNLEDILKIFEEIFVNISLKIY